MPLRSCEYQSCSQPVERSRGDCMICAGHFCADHLRPPFHACPSEETDPDAYYAAYDAVKEQYLASLLAKINVQELISSASRLRDGIPCTIPALAADADTPTRIKAVSGQMGGQNCHLDVRFEDGVVWLARIRLGDPTLPPKPVQDYLLTSEVATLKFLEGLNIPTPKVFHHAIESPSNPVGVAIILMEKLKGSVLDWNRASKDQRTKVMEQLADIFLELDKYPFPATGSLVDSAGTIGGFAQVQLFKSPTASLGPFDALESSLDAILRQQLDLISEGELSSFPVDTYLSHRWRMDMIPSLVSSSDGNQFFLHHLDDKGDHILVDEQYNITGIIDWEFASAEAKQLAFSSPCMMWPVGDFYDGKNELADEELEFADIFRRRGRPDMVEIVLNARKFQKFLFFLGGVPVDQAEFEALFQGLRASMLADGEEQLDSYQEWRKKAIEKYSADTRLSRLLRVGGRTLRGSSVAR